MKLNTDILMLSLTSVGKVLLERMLLLMFKNGWLILL